METKKPEKKYRGVYQRDPGSGVWWIRYQADGKPKREKVGRKSDAIALYQQRKSEIRAGAKLPPNMRHKGETLSDVLDRAISWYRSHRRPNTARTSVAHLETIKNDLGHRIAIDLKPSDVDEWISRHEKWTPATKNRYKASLGRALQLAVVSGHLQRNVARLVQARRENNMRVRWLHDDEEQRLFAVAHKNYPKQVPALLIALHTGMRSGEQFTLQWKGVDLERRKVFLAETKDGKSREIPMNETCFKAFSDLYATKRDSWVFQSNRYKRRLLNPRQYFETLLRDAKITDFHWHDLRHTFASRLVMKGVSLLTVSKLMGHSTTITTQRYAHLAPEHLTEAISRLDTPAPTAQPSA